MLFKGSLYLFSICDISSRIILFNILTSVKVRIYLTINSFLMMIKGSIFSFLMIRKMEVCLTISEVLDLI